VSAVRRVLGGEVYLSRKMSSWFLERIVIPGAKGVGQQRRAQRGKGGHGEELLPQRHREHGDEGILKILKWDPKRAFNFLPFFFRNSVFSVSLW
jgi:hypothetical protein